MAAQLTLMSGRSSGRCGRGWPGHELLPVPVSPVTRTVDCERATSSICAAAPRRRGCGHDPVVVELLSRSARR